MGTWGRRVNGKAPAWSEGQRDLTLTHFLIPETNFLTKLSLKFGKFRIHKSQNGECGSTSAPEYDGVRGSFPRIPSSI